MKKPTKADFTDYAETPKEVEKLNDCRNFIKALNSLSGKNTYTMHEQQQIHQLTKKALKCGRNSTIMPNKDFIKMPFEKGHTYSLGRPKGSKNKSTEIVKQTVAKVAAAFTIDEILYEIRGLEGRDKLNAIFHLWKFVVPIPRDEVSGDSSPDTRTAWIDKIMAVDPEELNQKIMDEISRS